MSKKFEANRSVSLGYCKIPICYTNIFKPGEPLKELVLMDKIGNNYEAAYRNNELNKIGPTFLLKATSKGFIYKDKEYKHRKGGWVF